jgi:hypothetical protein
MCLRRSFIDQFEVSDANQSCGMRTCIDLERRRKQLESVGVITTFIELNNSPNTYQGDTQGAEKLESN